MGAWGVKPLEADQAQEWLLALWEKYPLQADIRKALDLDVEDHHEHVRAATFTLLTLETSGLWITDELQELCGLAASRLRAIAAMEIYQDEEFQAELAEEIAALENRTVKGGEI